MGFDGGEVDYSTNPVDTFRLSGYDVCVVIHNNVRPKTIKVLNVLVTADSREQQEIAAAAGLSAQYLSMILKGDRPLTVRAVAGLARALRVDAHVLAEEFTREELIELAMCSGSQKVDRHEPDLTERPRTSSSPSGVDPTPYPLPASVPAPLLGEVPAGEPQPKDGAEPHIEPPKRKPKRK